MSCKGVILAGGAGTRLYPTTKAVCKQLLPIYNKPLIYYPLSTLMLAGIKDILIISTSKDISNFMLLFKDGSRYGLHIEYAIQEKPNGIAEAFIIGERFIGKDNVCLILGDNIFFGHGLTALLEEAVLQSDLGASVFVYQVKDPQRYGVITFDTKMKPIAIEEKPKKPISNWVTTGIYFYNNEVIDIAKNLKPSERGELEITDINNIYLGKGKLGFTLLGRGFAWLDTGTHESFIEASMFIKTIEDRQGLEIGNIEEIARNKGWIK